MTVFVVLLRAVNVGGTGKLPMSELVAMCEAAGFNAVRTYIASGNVVFSGGNRSEAKVKAALSSALVRELFLDGATIVIDQGTGLPDTVSFSGHHTAGNGVHNPPFLEALLKASIQHGIDFYGIPAPAPGFDLTIRVDRSQFRR